MMGKDAHPTCSSILYQPSEISEGIFYLFNNLKPTLREVLMKVFTKFTLLLLLFCSWGAKAGVFSITEQQINHYLENRLAEKVPLQDTVGLPPLFELDYKLHHLLTRIGQTEEKKVEISGIIDGIINTRGKRYDVQMQLNMDTVPYFEPEKGALYLKDVRLLSWQVTPEKYQRELQMFLPLLADGIAGILNSQPVYTLDESKTNEAMLKKFGKAILIEKGQLRLETSLF